MVITQKTYPHTLLYYQNYNMMNWSLLGFSFKKRSRFGEIYDWRLETSVKITVGFYNMKTGKSNFDQSQNCSYFVELKFYFKINTSNSWHEEVVLRRKVIPIESKLIVGLECDAVIVIIEHAFAFPFLTVVQIGTEHLVTGMRNEQMVQSNKR